MATLAASGVTLVRNWKGLDHYSYKEVTVVLDAAGTTTTMPSTAFGYATIKGCSNLIQSDNTDIINASPNYAGTAILLQNGGATTPLAATGTYRMTVWGTPSSL